MNNFANLNENLTNFTYFQFVADIDKCTIFSSSALFTTIFNFLLILSCIFQKNKENYADLIIFSMGICDFIAGVLVLPGLFLLLLKDLSVINMNISSELFEYMIVSIDNSTFQISLFLLLALSYHRYRQLSSPFKEKSYLNRFRITAIISIWLISIIYWFLTIWLTNSLSFYDGKFAYLIGILITNYLPILLIIVINFLIIKHFNIRIEKNRFIKQSLKKERNATACTVSITLNLVGSCFFYLIINPFELYNFEFVKYLLDIHYIIYYYTALNPLCVLFFNSKLKKVLRKIHFNRFNPTIKRHVNVSTDKHKK